MTKNSKRRSSSTKKGVGGTATTTPSGASQIQSAIAASTQHRAKRKRVPPFIPEYPEGPLTCRNCGLSKPHTHFKRLRTRPTIMAPICLLCMHKGNVHPADNKANGVMLAQLTSEQAAVREMAQRELCRRRLMHFVKRFHPGYLDGWFHRDVCERLERFMRAVEAGKSPRLILMAPPRSGKSRIVSDMFPSWVLGHHPEWEFIAGSYNVSLPTKFSRHIRERLASETYKQVFKDTRLSAKSQSAEEWETTEGGGFKAVGTEGGATGRGAHIFSIDDPVKDQEEADSEVQRSKVWDWYGTVAQTRLAPGGGVLLTLTRWNDDDLAGRLIALQEELKKQGVPDIEIDNWEIVSYPAIADKPEYLTEDKRIVYEPVDGVTKIRDAGEALHPERYTREQLLRIKRAMQPRHWSALYQQKPVPDEGLIFKTSDIRYYDEPMDFSEGFHTYMTGDLALGQKQTNTRSVYAVGSVDANGDMYVRDCLIGRWDTLELVEIFLDTYARYNTMLAGIERGPTELAIAPVLKRRMQERNLYPSMYPDLHPISDKVARARPLQGRMQQGKVWFPRGQPWVEEAIHELLRFPGGKLNDIVDALAWLVRLSMSQAPPTGLRKREKPVKSWKSKLKNYTKSGDNTYLVA